MRFQQHEDWRDKALPGWGYAFAYGSFFENQFKLSAGKLGDSPWGTGGPEMWQDLDTRIGIRAEYMPGFLPGLNLGFVLNDINSTEDRTVAEKTLLNMLEESVVGFSYINDYFLVRFAYRFDSILDDDKGGQMVYRLEERVLNNFLPGFQIWANGYYTGIGDDDELQGSTILQNWLYLQYAPEDFTAQLRLGYDVMGKRANIFYLRPSFYYNFFNNFLSAGLSFSFGQEFGDEVRNPGKPYLYWELQPMIRLNFGNAYVALVYQYSSDYKYRDTNTMENLETKWQWVNLRVVFTF
jgi:hypothetical protein